MSGDSPAKQKKFHAKYDFPYPLLCDESHEMLTAYGVWGPKTFIGRTYDGITRMSYLIDETGKVVKVYPKVKVAEHPAEVLTDWAELGR